MPEREVVVEIRCKLGRQERGTQIPERNGHAVEKGLVRLLLLISAELHRDRLRMMESPPPIDAISRSSSERCDSSPLTPAMIWMTRASGKLQPLFLYMPLEGFRQILKGPEVYWQVSAYLIHEECVRSMEVAGIQARHDEVHVRDESEARVED